MTDKDYAPPQNVGDCFDFDRNLSSLLHRPAGNMAVLDGLRALSILFVMLFHSMVYLEQLFPPEFFVYYLSMVPPWLRWMWQGNLGVDIFFVLSGFLIGGMLLREHAREGRLSVKRFYLRRFMRLMPVYVIVLLLFTLRTDIVGFEKVWQNILYINNFFPFRETYLNWTWSLAVEEQFYLVFPLFLTFLFFKTENKVRLLLIVFGLSFVIRLLILLTDETMYTSSLANQIFLFYPGFNESLANQVYDNLYTRFGPLILGALAAWLHFRHSEALKRFFLGKTWLATLTLLLSIAVIIGLLHVPVQDFNCRPGALWQLIYFTAGRNVFALAVMIIMLSAIYGEGLASLVRRFLSLKLWYPIAQLAYSLYLAHLFFMPWAVDFVQIFYFGPPDFVALRMTFVMLITLLFSSIFCGFLYVFVERPIMGMREIYNIAKY